MCGIIGATGDGPVLSILLEGLARLDYRGYDSAGVALQWNGTVWRARRAGRLDELTAVVASAPAPAHAGIGHTRWATHGRPNEENAHPHLDCTGRLAIIHNGILENYVELGDELSAAGHELMSETDTEVLAHLIEREVAGGLRLADAVRSALRLVEGKFAIAVVHADDPGLIVGARRGSPLIAGRNDTTGFLASDIPAILGQTREIYVIDDDRVVEVGPGKLLVTTLEGETVEPDRRCVEWDLEAAERGGFEDFMLKEIHEQPQAVHDTLLSRLLPSGALKLDQMRLADEDLREVDKVFVLGCGTSYHAGLVAKYAIEHWTRLPVETEIASEFRYRDPVLDSSTLVVGVSQSGETIDTMEACSWAKRQRAKVLAITNVVDSSMARDADAVLYTRAGPEIGVAATKTHLAQIVAMELLALWLAQIRGLQYPEESLELLGELHELPEKVAAVLARGDQIMEAARRHVDVRDFFFIGRGIGYPVALEGALKLKEISYLRAEGYPAGELKHGPIALIEEGVVVVGVASRGRRELWQKMMNNVREVQARGATVVLVAEEDDEVAAAHADTILPVPRTHYLFSPAVDVVALQLFAYALAKAKGNDVDKPRNLAKTVTVE